MSDYIFNCYVDVLILCMTAFIPLWYTIYIYIYDNKTIIYNILTDSCPTFYCKASGHFILVKKLNIKIFF